MTESILNDRKLSLNDKYKSIVGPFKNYKKNMGWNWNKDNEKNYQEILKNFLIHNFNGYELTSDAKLTNIIDEKCG